MTDAVFVTLLILHVGSIVGWLGGAILFVSVITPSIRKLSMPARSELIASLVPRYTRFVGATSLIGILSGLILYGYSTQVMPTLGPSSSGLVYIQAGAVLGLIVIVIAFGVVIPSGRKLVSLVKQTGQGQNAMADIENVQKRLGIGARVGGALLGIALVLMIIGASL